MLESTASLGQAVIAGVWDLFSTPVPGFTFTFRQMWLGFAVCSLSLLLLKYLLGGGGSSGSSTRSVRRVRARLAPRGSDGRVGAVVPERVRAAAGCAAGHSGLRR